MRPRAKARGQSADAERSVAVYDGRHHLGDVIDLCCRVAAQLDDGTDLGTFPNQQAATDAIIAASKVAK